MKTLWMAMALGLMAWCLTHCGGSSHPSADDVGNGGDTRPKAFERGRAKAVKMVEAISHLNFSDLQHLPPGRAQALVTWYDANRQALAEDIQSTPPYLWRRFNPNAACGFTGPTARAPIALSYAVCPLSFTVGKAATQLVGESVHHFGVRDDDFAALVANAVTDAWERIAGGSIPSTQSRQAFEQARLYGSEILQRVPKDLLQAASEDYLSREETDWLWKNRGNVASHLLSTNHHWVDDELPQGQGTYQACAQAESTSGASLVLSYQGCEHFEARKQIVQLLLHQVLRDREQKPEAISERMASAVQRAWRMLGHWDSPHWFEMNGGDIPFHRELATPIWTGKELVTWTNGEDLAYYNPRTNTWRKEVAVTSHRNWHSGPYSLRDRSAIWAGAKIVVYGGCSLDPTESGESYDPKTREWNPISAKRAPLIKGAQLLSTGDKMVLWGGDSCFRGDPPIRTGGVYDPATDTWETIPAEGSFPFLWGQSQVLIGDKLMVWGGGSIDVAKNRVLIPNRGGIYDLKTRKWKLTNPKGAPAGRFSPLLVAAGKKVIVYGGYEEAVSQHPFNAVVTGAIYDPERDEWQSMAEGPVHADGDHPLFGAWDLRRVLVWGKGKAFYDPLKDRWTSLDATPNPAFVQNYRADWYGENNLFWTGVELLVWNVSQGIGFAFFP